MISLEFVPEDSADNNSAMVYVMIWCHQAPSHYLDWCLQSSMMKYSMALIGLNGFDWVYQEPMISFYWLEKITFGQFVISHKYMENKNSI